MLYAKIKYIFNKNRAILARAIFDVVDIIYIKDEFPIGAQYNYLSNYLRVNPSYLIGNLIMTPEIIQSLLR